MLGFTSIGHHCRDGPDQFIRANTGGPVAMRENRFGHASFCASAQRACTHWDMSSIDVTGVHSRKARCSWLASRRHEGRVRIREEPERRTGMSAAVLAPIWAVAQLTVLFGRVLFGTGCRVGFALTRTSAGCAANHTSCCRPPLPWSRQR